MDKLFWTLLKSVLCFKHKTRLSNRRKRDLAEEALLWITGWDLGTMRWDMFSW